MHARLSARGFYERLGYRVTSETFAEVTIPHVMMEKTLGPNKS
jgi:predicted GNAT family N-acyltransferase